MTALSRNPENQNRLLANKFTLNFSRLPNMQFWCQSVNIPGISLSEVITENPFLGNWSPGEKAVYDILTVTFIVDEDILAWKEIHDWIRAMTFPQRFQEYRDLRKLHPFADKVFPQFSDAAITLLTSANVPQYRFKFYDVFPTTLSPILLNSQSGPDEVVTADATFRYSLYDIEKID